MKIDVGSDFSGVGSLDQALRRLKIKYRTIFSCDMDKYARESYISNYGEPKYYPLNVYDREIPKESLDLYVTSPPCQSFSLGGNRKGEEDKRGVLFYNSHEFIQVNKPRFFTFENVKGLLSDNDGKTFQNWINLLGGKSVNGNPVMFPLLESTPYHIYHTVLNAKHYGVPQNRERVFIVGIRDDLDNSFHWPKPVFLENKLKNCLEDNVDDKYFLSERMINGFNQKKNNFSGRFEPLSGDENYAKCLTTKSGSNITDNYIKTGFINQDSQASSVYSGDGISPTICAGSQGYANGYVQVLRRRTEEGKANRRQNIKSGKDYTSFSDREMFIQNDGQIANALTTSMTKDNLLTNFYKIRRLTPRECFRLMDFPESYKIIVSDTQAYKQAGNSIVVAVMAAILKKLNLN